MPRFLPSSGQCNRPRVCGSDSCSKATPADYRDRPDIGSSRSASRPRNAARPAARRYGCSGAPRGTPGRRGRGRLDGASPCSSARVPGGRAEPLPTRASAPRPRAGPARRRGQPEPRGLPGRERPPRRRQQARQTSSWASPARPAVRCGGADRAGHGRIAVPPRPWSALQIQVGSNTPPSNRSGAREAQGWPTKVNWPRISSKRGCYRASSGPWRCTSPPSLASIRARELEAVRRGEHHIDPEIGPAEVCAARTDGCARRSPVRGPRASDGRREAFGQPDLHTVEPQAACDRQPVGDRAGELQLPVACRSSSSRCRGARRRPEPKIDRNSGASNRPCLPG